MVIEIPKVEKPRSDLEQMLDISHYRQDNFVLPLVLDYLSLVRLGYKPNYILGRMYAFYCPKENKEG